MLAIHGLTGHGRRWEQLAACIARNPLRCTRSARPRQVIVGRAVDHRRQCRRLAALLDEEADTPVLVVGHSFGGAVALHLAATRPDQVAALLLLDPAIGLDGAWMRDRAAMFSFPDYPDPAEARRKRQRARGRTWTPPLLDAELDEHLVAAAQRTIRLARQHAGDDVVLE